MAKSIQSENFSTLVERGLEVRKSYNQLNAQQGHKPWSTAEYMQGFMGDVGKLAKLIMAKNNYRYMDNVDDALRHELADCLWSIIAIADSLNIDLEEAFFDTMDELDTRITNAANT